MVGPWHRYGPCCPILQEKRHIVGPGTGIDTDLFVRGTPLNVKFDAGCEAIRREVMENGWEHHYALMYGDRVDELTAFCRNMNIEMHLVK